ncbi:MAG: metallophosphoesterase family protein, partial [Myxococcota bacterium]
MTTLRPLVLLWFAWLIFGCASPGPELERPGLAGGVPWTGKPVATAPDHFKFLVVTDRTGEHRHGVFAGAIDRINLLAPAFVVSVGDLVEGYTEDPGEIAAQWDEVDAMLERLDAPFFYAAGNHDFSNEAMARDWHARRGPSYYHFLYQDVLFLVLNSEIFPGVGRRDGVIGGPDVQADQLAYAREVLAAHRDARWTFVVIHRPLWDRREVHADWLAVEEWLGERPYTVLAGHRHRYTSQRRHDHRYVTLATTGGGSRMRGIERGEFDHVALVSVGDGEPVIANLMLDGIHGVDARSGSTRSTPGARSGPACGRPVTSSGSSPSLRTRKRA